jgi:hypothetical protein
MVSGAFNTMCDYRELYSNADLNHPLVKEYFAKGYLIIPSVLDEETIKEVSDHVDWLQKRYPDIDPELLEHWLMRDDPYWINLVKHPKLLEVVKLFLGPNLATFASHYVCKPARTGKRIHWHQDGAYWPLKPMHVLSIWLAVDDSKIDNGCVQYAEASHIDGLKTNGLSSNDFAAHVQKVHSGMASDMYGDVSKKYKIVNAELKAGDILIHHPYMIHGSQENLSDKRRCGLTIRYIPTSTHVIYEGDDVDKATTSGSVFFACGDKDPNVQNYYRPVPKFSEDRHFKSKNWQQFL